MAGSAAGSRARPGARGAEEPCRGGEEGVVPVWGRGLLVRGMMNGCGR